VWKCIYRYINVTFAGRGLKVRLFLLTSACAEAGSNIDIYWNMYIKIDIHTSGDILYIYDVPLAGRGLRVRFLLLASIGTEAEADASAAEAAAAEADADMSAASLVLCASPAYVWCK